MSSFTFLLLCIQFFLVQMVLSQAIGCGRPAPVAACGGPCGAGPAGWPGAAYGGVGSGTVAVSGRLPVSGRTALTGSVPISGAVWFRGPAAAAGAVSIAGRCSCGCAPRY